MKIVLFGKMRSGKDTVGKMLIEDYNFKRFAFGDGIGEIIEKYFPKAFENGKPRHHYQFIGQQLRQLNEDVWIEYLLNGVAKAEQENGAALNVVVCDGRQINEAERMKSEGYVIIKVEADENVRLERIMAEGDTFDPKHLQHETELQVDQVKADYIIKNDGTLDDLNRKVYETVIQIRAKELGMTVEEYVVALFLRRMIGGGFFE